MGKDVFYTPEWAVVDMIKFFKPKGEILDPCTGKGIFLKHLPKDSYWCEITEGRDFFDWNKKIDWVVGNPPYSLFAKWIYHSMEIAKNILYLIPCDKPFISMKMLNKMREWGSVKHMRVYGSGGKLNFPIGFAIGAVHICKGYKGSMEISFYD
jgi:hypothetical protein